LPLGPHLLLLGPKPKSTHSVFDNRARSSRLAGWGKSALVPMAVALAMGAMGLGRARASEARGVPALGEALSLVGSDVKDATRVELNGHAVEMHAAHSKLGVSAVLAYVQRACETGAEHVPEALGDLEASVARGAPKTGRGGIGILRDESKDRGAVLCFATDRDESENTLRERLRAFVSTQDLSAVGKLRYVSVRKDGDGSFVLGAWVNESLPLARMFPDTGDADGHDPQAAPRPTGATRFLTLESQGRPFAVYGYAVPEGQGASAYASQLGRAGFAETALGRPSDLRVFRRGNVEVLVVLGEPGTLTFVEMSSPLRIQESQQ
jgi:hypothetical protein